MILSRDLKNRIYSGKNCMKFEYDLVDESKSKDDQSRNCFVARFERSNEDENEWNMLIVLKRTRDADSQVYNFGYVMPKSNLPLELIAATGLKYFQLYLQQEVQTKMDYDFVLSDVLRGM